MQSTRTTRRLALTVALGAVIRGGAACSTTVTPSTVTATQVAEQAATTLQKQEPNLALAKISCPKNLDFKVGASETCIVTAKNGKTAHLGVTISAIKGSNANLRFTLSK